MIDVYILRKKAVMLARLNNTSMTFKSTWNVLRGGFGKTNKTIEVEEIIFEGKEFTEW